MRAVHHSSLASLARRALFVSVLASAFLAPALASAEETMKPITIVGRAAKPSVVIEIKRETPPRWSGCGHFGLRPLTPPKSFMGNQ